MSLKSTMNTMRAFETVTPSKERDWALDYIDALEAFLAYEIDEEQLDERRREFHERMGD